MENEITLKLKIYRGLGIELEREGERGEGGGGEYSKAVIRNAGKGDVHVVNMDNKFSKYFYTNYFWQTL